MTPLFPYQNVGVDYIANRERAGLHDEMGIGKTAQAIRAINAIDAKRGIVVCKAKLRENWLREFHKFSLVPYKIVKGNDIYDFAAWQRGRFNILITSYELATKWAKYVYEEAEPMDFVVLDEGHFVKNTDAKRTKAILGPHMDLTDGGLARWSEYVWHLSGTPMANDPMDIFTFLKMCGATDLSERAFTKRYFYSDSSLYGSRQTIRQEMLGELTYLIENNRIRRTKKEVGIQLPPIFLSGAVVDGDMSGVVDLLRNHPGLEANIIHALSQGGLSFLDAQHIMTLRRLIGEAKSVPYAHILADELKISGNQKIVFGCHVQALKNVYDILSAHKIRCVLVAGPLSDKEQQARIDAFQAGEADVFIGNMHSSGLGTTLTAGNEIDIMESDWTPAGNAQAIARAHRIGQHRNVYARFISLANSFDTTVNRIVAAKVKAILEIEGEDSILANALPAEDDDLDDISSLL